MLSYQNPDTLTSFVRKRNEKRRSHVDILSLCLVQLKPKIAINPRNRVCKHCVSKIHPNATTRTSAEDDQVPIETASLVGDGIVQPALWDKFVWIREHFWGTQLEVV